MALKLGAVALAVVLLAIAFQGLTSGGDDGETVSLSRPASIPTATLPATLSAPMLLGEANPLPAGRPAGGGAGSGSYVVKSGDTLTAIAIQMNVPSDQQAAWIAEVLRLNGIADVRLLAVGQELNLPRAATPAAAAARTTGTPPPGGTAPARTPTPATSSAPATTAPATAATAAPSPTPRPATMVTGGGGTYTVAAGDFPLLIASKLGVPEPQQLTWADQLMSLNGLCSSCLQVGQVLQLPAGSPAGGGAAPAPTPRP